MAQLCIVLVLVFLVLNSPRLAIGAYEVGLIQKLNCFLFVPFFGFAESKSLLFNKISNNATIPT